GIAETCALVGKGKKIAAGEALPTILRVPPGDLAGEIGTEHCPLARVVPRRQDAVGGDGVIGFALVRAVVWAVSVTEVVWLIHLHRHLRMRSGVEQPQEHAGGEAVDLHLAYPS